jgi:hypothetical protein
MAFVVRLLFAVFVTGGALPAGGPSAVHGYDIVEEDGKTTQSASAHARNVRYAKRGTHRSRGFEVLEVPSVLGPTRASAQAPTWMRPRRTPPPDDDNTIA